MQSPRDCSPLVPRGVVKKGVVKRGYKREARRGRKLCKEKTRQAKQEQLQSRCPSRSHPHRPAGAAGDGPAEQHRAANMIYFLAAIVPLSGACKGSTGAQAGANAISSGGSEITRATLGKHSGADGPWAGPSSTVPGHSVPSKGSNKALWTPGTEVGGREGGSGPWPRVFSLAEASQGPVVSVLKRGHCPAQLPGAQAAQPSCSPTKGLRVDPQAPLGHEEMACSPPLEQAEAGASPGSTAKSCPLPTGFRSANPAGRAQVTFPQTPHPGCPQASAARG